MNGTPLNPFLLLPVWLLLAFYGSAQSQPKPEQFEVSGSQSSGEIPWGGSATGTVSVQVRFANTSNQPYRLETTIRFKGTVVQTISEIVPPDTTRTQSLASSSSIAHSGQTMSRQLEWGVWLSYYPVGQLPISGEKEEKRLRQDFFDLPEENAPESDDHQNP